MPPVAHFVHWGRQADSMLLVDASTAGDGFVVSPDGVVGKGVAAGAAPDGLRMSNSANTAKTTNPASTADTI